MDMLWLTTLTTWPTAWQLDPTPEPDDVVAGWGAFGLFGLGLVVIALLGWSLVRELRKVDAAEEQGLYDPTDRKPHQGVPQAGPDAPPGRGLKARHAPQQDDPQV